MYGPVRTVVWEDGRGDSPSYPILATEMFRKFISLLLWALVFVVLRDARRRFTVN